MRDLLGLVVDDSKVGRITMKKKLESMGVQVTLVESGQQALDYLVQNRPDMIFMDHQMPEMDGFEATRRIKASPATQDIPVVIISGNDEPDFVEAALASGALAAIVKPPDDTALKNLLAALPDRAAAIAPSEIEAMSEQAIVVPVAAPTLNAAELDALIERKISENLVPLRDQLLTEMRRGLGAEAANLRGELARQTAALVELQHRARDAANLEKQFAALERRLHDLEAGARQTPPDFTAMEKNMRAHIEQQTSASLSQHQRALQAEVQAKITALESRLAAVRQEVQAKLTEQLAHVNHEKTKEETEQKTLAQMNSKVKTLTITTIIAIILLLVMIGVVILGA